MKKRIYLDYAASTPMDKKVLEAMMPYLKEEYGNASSAHTFGQKARAAVEGAREQVAAFLGCKADEVIFTSGATEANNLTIQGVIKSTLLFDRVPRVHHGAKPHIVTTAIEHESVLEPCKTLERRGIAEVTYVAPQKDGVVLAKDVQTAIKESTVFVSVMYANSEIGAIQPVAEIGQIIQEIRRNNKGSYPVFHIDAVQAANYLDCNVEKLGCDLLTLSGHKIYGPKGVGVLYIKSKTPIGALLEGGGQELGMRSGTENVAAIVGMGQAIQEIQSSKSKIQNMQQLRDEFIKEVLQKISGSQVTGSLEKRLPNNVHVRFAGVQARDLVMLLDQKGVAASVGSACSEKTQEPSHVLGALGLSEAEAGSAARFTLGKDTTPKEMQQAVQALFESVAQLQKNKI
ncbi:MAG TPA: cysteine desulfurase family protein [Candidatus Paceibacterota bacterium]